MTVNEFGRCNNETPENSPRKLKALVDAQQKVIEEYGQRLAALEAKVFPLAVPLVRTEPLATRCNTCDLQFSGTMGYCCSRTDCPMSVKVGDFPFGLNTGG
jgi:hypothetical protein